MDKILSELERQRRAENIYYTRRNAASSYDNTDEKSSKGIYKTLFQILFFINIVIIIFCMQNIEYVFKDEFVSDIKVLVENIKKRANDNTDLSYLENENIVSNESINKNEGYQENTVDIENTNITESKENVEKVITKTEEEQEIEALIGMYQFKKPIEVNGVITSGFGERISDDENVSEYHTGIDIGAEYGTEIKSSVTGIVTLVSSVGDYGKQVRIRNNNVTTLYAHCSEILVNEGDIVADGQVIAKVGSTGNSTGPHLHFEIRVDDRCLDPAKLVLF